MNAAEFNAQVAKADAALTRAYEALAEARAEVRIMEECQHACAGRIRLGSLRECAHKIASEIVEVLGTLYAPGQPDAVMPNHVAGAKAFAQDQRGGAAVEFAIMSMPFVLLLGGIIGFALLYLAQYGFEVAVAKAARDEIKATAISQPFDETKMRNSICAVLPVVPCAPEITATPFIVGGKTKFVTVHASMHHKLIDALPSALNLGNLKLDSTVVIRKDF